METDTAFRLTPPCAGTYGLSGKLLKACLFLFVASLLSDTSPVFSQEACTKWGRDASVQTDCADCAVPASGLACLHVVISGISEDKGVVRLSLYDAAENYEAREHSCRFDVLPVKDMKSDVVFNNLKPGWYAVLLYHDANNNNHFDRVMGIPAERFGFSNNIRPRITGAPDFEEARFRLEPDMCVTHEIRLQSLFNS